MKGNFTVTIGKRVWVHTMTRATAVKERNILKDRGVKAVVRKGHWENNNDYIIAIIE